MQMAQHMDDRLSPDEDLDLGYSMVDDMFNHHAL